MSKTWLLEQALRETKEGWTDGPRWRLTSERTPDDKATDELAVELKVYRPAA